MPELFLFGCLRWGLDEQGSAVFTDYSAFSVFKTAFITKHLLTSLESRTVTNISPEIVFLNDATVNVFGI